MIEEIIDASMNQTESNYCCRNYLSCRTCRKTYFEKLAGIPVEVHIASEFGYNIPLLSEKPLFIFISQSGETADSRQVLVKVKELGYQALTITNVPGSTFPGKRITHYYYMPVPRLRWHPQKPIWLNWRCWRFPLMSLEKQGKKIDFDLKNELAIAANAIQTIVDSKEELHKISKEYLSQTRKCVLHRADYRLLRKFGRRLKLKEISYIQAEGFAGGELKHGTIALIEKGTPVIALVTQAPVALNIRGNVKEVVARGANPS